jgi:hypothetical protein
LPFVEHETVELPIVLYASCEGVRCGENETCDALGRCVSAEINPESCLTPGAPGCEPDGGAYPDAADAAEGNDAGIDAETTAPTVGWTVDETTVGLAPLGLVCNQLPAYSGPYEIPAGTVMSGRRFTDGVSLYQGDITIERSCFQPNSVGSGLPIAGTTNYNGESEPGRGKVIIRDCEFDGTLLSDEIARTVTAFSGIADLQRNYIRHLGSGISLSNTGTQQDALVEHNFVVDTGSSEGSSFVITDFTDADRPDRVAIIRNNRFGHDTSTGSGAARIVAASERIVNVTFEGNLLEGPGYNLVLEWSDYGYSNLSAINNRFIPTGFGATYSTGPGWAIWQENYLYDPAMPDGKGQVVNP